MKKILISMMCLSLLVFVLSGASYGWQGRMDGMGAPYGLLQDDSDFLIHPAKIANGEGIQFYGHYRFTYTDVMNWDYNLDRLTPAGVLTNFYSYNTSGLEYKNNGLLGAATPLGPGRFGIFFTYDGKRGDYNGDEYILGAINPVVYELTSDFDNFALRLLYGLPLDGFNLGGEVQFAHRQEKNENDIPNRLNYILGTSFPQFNLSPFQLPYDSNYWEALFKGSLEGMVGPLDLEFTLRGGFIFAGDNNLLLTEDTGFFDADGGVKGWRIGGDMWVRYSLMDDLSLPFMVRVDYEDKTRDGEGLGQGTFSATWNFPYENNEQNLHLEAGGGVDKEFGKGVRIAAGIYYNYLQGQYDIMFSQVFPVGSPRFWDHSDYPASIEHQVMLRLAGELELSPTATLRMGLVPFYGWVREDFAYTESAIFIDDITLDGYRWGIGASLGGSVRFNSFTMEPFFNVGWQQFSLDGDGQRITAGVITNLWDMDLSRNEWYIGGGCSFLYDLP